MCNILRRDHKEIPKSGLAWKLFRKPTGFGKRALVGLFNPDKYEKTKAGWINWREEDKNIQRHSDDVGFCAFKTKAEAIRCKRDLRYDSVVLKRIKYRDGLGLHQEDGMIGGSAYDTIIVKSFHMVD